MCLLIFITIHSYSFSRIERPASPTESVLSVTSHSATNKRSRSSAQHRAASPSRDDHYNGLYDQRQSNGVNGRRDFNVPPSASHPSLPLPYHVNGNGYLSGPASDWAPSHNQLEGPGMPVARPFGALSATPGPLGTTEPVVDVNDGDAEGDGDDKQYCFCNRASFGEMIACDEPSCEVEWVSCTCVLASPSLFSFSFHSTTSSASGSPSRQKVLGSVIPAQPIMQPRRMVDDPTEVANEKLQAIVLVDEPLPVPNLESLNPCYSDFLRACCNFISTVTVGLSPLGVSHSCNYSFCFFILSDSRVAQINLWGYQLTIVVVISDSFVDLREEL